MDEANAIISLYLPELRREFDRFFLEGRALHAIATTMYFDKLSENKEGYAAECRAKEEYRSLVKESREYITKFETAGRKLLMEILGIAQ